ncbi:MAG: pilus assembly protein TadG-related protein [Acidobacteriaceae bacterium]
MSESAGLYRQRTRGPVTHRFFQDEGGQVLPWVVVVMVAVLGIAAFSVDLARAMVVQHQLQSSADAAALAAAESISGTSTTYETVASNYSSATGDKNTYSGVSAGTPTVTGLCLTTVTGWGIACTSSGGSVTVPNAVRVTETATLPTLFAGIFGKPTLTISATSTAARARPMPYNIALIVDSTLSMDLTDSNCGGITQEQCALNGAQQLLQGLSTTYDHVALFTFPDVVAGANAQAGVAITSSGTSQTYTCTTTVPSSYNGVAYTSWEGVYTPYLQSIGGRGEPSSYEPPYPGRAWAMPYVFPAKPTNDTGYTIPSGSYPATYQITPFVEDYNTVSGSTTSLNPDSVLVQAVGGKSGCGGIAPSSFDGNMGTYYPGALYAAQAALLKEQANHANSTNVMIILGDGNATAPQTNGPIYTMPTSAAQATTTYQNSTTVASGAYTYPSSYLTASSNASYPSWNGECGQEVDAAQYAATYASGGVDNNTLVYTVAYGSPSTSSSANCGSDLNAGDHQGIAPCTALQDMATQVSGYSISPYFYSDWTMQGGDSGCQANSDNSGITAINQIYAAIAAKLSSARLIPNNTQ